MHVDNIYEQYETANMAVQVTKVLWYCYQLQPIMPYIRPGDTGRMQQTKDLSRSKYVFLAFKQVHDKGQ